MVVGFGGIHAITWRDRTVQNLAYRLDPAVWGRGYAHEIVAAALTAWRDLEPQVPLVARTTEDNIPSQRTAARGGLIRRPDLDVQKPAFLEITFALGWD